MTDWRRKEREEGVTEDPMVPPFVTDWMAVQIGCRSKIKFGEKSNAFGSDTLEHLWDSSVDNR